MFELTIQSEFCAAHALSIGGLREAVHGHNWRLTITLEGETLDNDGLLCDFHTVKDVLEEIIAPLNNADLNTSDAFKGVNPSAENVARYVAEELSRRLAPLAPVARVAGVSVTEAPGCSATYRPPVMASKGGVRHA